MTKEVEILMKCAVAILISYCGIADLNLTTIEYYQAVNDILKKIDSALIRLGTSLDDELPKVREISVEEFLSVEEYCRYIDVLNDPAMFEKFISVVAGPVN